MLKRFIRLAGLSRLLKRLLPQRAARDVPGPHLLNTKAPKTSPGRTIAVTDLTAMEPTVGLFTHGHPAGPDNGGAPPALLSEMVLHDSLEAYLTDQGNSCKDIVSLRRILAMDTVILETGSGGGEVAWEIAVKNPQMGVIATDKYDLTGIAGESSHYRKIALAWKEGCMKVQQTGLPNLVVLKAEAEILRFLPDNSIDSILVVNPEPLVGAAFVESIEKSGLLSKVKAGKNKIVIKPFSREMNVISCGGYEFDHSEDWSCGLGFILGSPLGFKKTDPLLWSVDLSTASPYCKNSTQNCAYVLGDEAYPPALK